MELNHLPDAYKTPALTIELLVLADGETRTHNQLFTKQLRYQLRYVGALLQFQS